MKVTILMPMGGLGKRFVSAGHKTPKPLISVDGRPMFLRALESFPAQWDITNVFVIRQDQDMRFGVSHMIADACPGARVAVLDHNTAGAVETCLVAANLIDRRNPLIVADCDIRFVSQAYRQLVESARLDGILASFASRDPRYSYAQVDAAGLVSKTAEKVVISNHALLGGYYFKSGAYFLDLANEFVHSGLGPNLKEYYLSHLYNMIIDRGGRVGLATVDAFDIWGTPEELEAYLRRKGSGS